jgi:hypothetical protein
MMKNGSKEVVNLYASARAEGYIERRIDDMTIDRIGVVNAELKNEIKQMYWQGVFTKSTYEIMLSKLQDRYDAIFDEYIKKLNDDCERRYQLLLKRYSGKS